VFQLVPLASCPVAGHQWKEPGSISLHLLSRYLCTLIRSSPSLLCCRLNSPSSLSLSSQERCCSPFIISVARFWTLSSMSMSLLCWGAQNWTQRSRCNLTSAEQKGRLTSLLLMAMFPLVQPRYCWLFCFLATRAHCLLMVNLVSTRTPRSFSAKLLCSWAAPSMYWCLWLCLPLCRSGRDNV